MFGRAADVVALAVGDDRDAQIAGPGDGQFQGLQAVGAVGLVASQLGLHGGAVAGDGLQQAEVEGQEGGRHALGRVTVDLQGFFDETRRQQGRPRVEAHAGDGTGAIDAGLEGVGGVHGPGG